MTCVNCQYQWCWLCQGEYKYGHYDRGNCRGQQFSEFNDISYFGLHKLFPCICPKNLKPIGFNKLWQEYIFIFVIWFFGIFIINFIVMMNIIEDFNFFAGDDAAVLWMFIFLLLDIGYFISFQISFSILITPFILICIIYPKFIGRYMYFFGIGKNLENE